MRLQRVLHLTATLAAFTSAAGALLAHGGRLSGHLDLFSHFAPLYAVAGLLAACATILLPGRRAPILAASAVASAAAVALVAPELVHARQPLAMGDEQTLKVIQFNVWRGNRGAARVVDWLASERPDVVVVEEATPDLRDALVARTGWKVVGARTTVMIFSRHPLIGQGVRPKIRTQAPVTWVNALMLHPAGAVPILGVHYAWPTTDPAGHQERAIQAVVEKLGTERLILAGDFNSTPWSSLRKAADASFGLQRVTRALFSWPAALANGHIPIPAPILPIDHIYVGKNWRVVRATRGPSLGSDHYPVVIVLKSQALRPAPSRSADEETQ